MRQLCVFIPAKNSGAETILRENGQTQFGQRRVSAEFIPRRGAAHVRKIEIFLHGERYSINAAGADTFGVGEV